MTTNRYIINRNAGGNIVFRTTSDGITFTDSLTIDGTTGTFVLPTSTTAATQAPGDSSTKLATTAFVTTADNLKANLNSPVFTGTPSLPTGTTAVTQSAGNSTTALATTQFVTTADNLKANLNSPIFTGTPSLPTGTIAVTQTAGDSSGKLATTQFVTTANNLKANLASPIFTGTPSLPTGTIAVTQATGDSSTKLATTAFVTTAVSTKADLNSPVFTGSPSLPTGTTAVTQSPGSSSTVLATTAFVTTADNLKANIASPSFTGLVIVTGAGTSTLVGTADPSASTTLSGSGTSFTTQLTAGDKITINSETRTIVSITSNTSLTVDRMFSDTPSASITKNPAIMLIRTSNNTIVGNIDYQGAWLVGPSVTGNATGYRHTISGGLQSGNTTNADQSSLLYITNNFYLDGSVASSSRTDTSTGGSGILFNNRTTATNEAFAILTNQPSDALTAAAQRIASATHQGIWTIGRTTGSVGPHLIYGGMRQKQVSGQAETGTLLMEEKDTTPASPTSGSEVKIYMKADKLVFQYNDNGTVRYKYLDLAGTSVTWVHSTTAP